MHSEKEILSLF